MHGKGKYSTLYESYEGDFVDNTFEGQGVYIFKSGAKYEGSFKNNQFEGKGK